MELNGIEWILVDLKVRECHKSSFICESADMRLVCSAQGGLKSGAQIVAGVEVQVLHVQEAGLIQFLLKMKRIQWDSIQFF